MNTNERVVDILKQAGEMSVNQIAEQLEVSRQMIHRSLNELVEKRLVEKLGRAPKTYYRIVDAPKPVSSVSDGVSAEQSKFLNEHFLIITETGNRLEGIEAMQFWCQRQRLPLQKTINEFIDTRKKYLKYFHSDGTIHGMEKLVQTKAFDKVHLDQMYYFDFYAIERFGKTKLGTLLHYAKQGQNKSLMQEVVDMTKPRLSSLLDSLNIDAVGYIPPTIKRNLQIMKFFENKYNLSHPHIKLKKISGAIVVPQKALNKIEDRISNARASIIVDETRSFSRVLLIDDAIGSGSTINETAGKLKAKGIAKWVAGVAITGSYKGFEVIQEI